MLGFRILVLGFGFVIWVLGVRFPMSAWQGLRVSCGLGFRGLGFRVGPWAAFGFRV